MRSILPPLLSPMQSHAKLLHDQFGGKEEIGVVFFGPCIAKKMEADRTPEYAQVSATFRDLKEMIEKSGIPKRSGKRGFCQQKASTGAYYPYQRGNDQKPRKGPAGIRGEGIHRL